MSKFDPTKDVEVWTDSMATSDRSKLHVSVMQYDGGVKKVALSRTFVNSAEIEQHGKTGRLSEGEIRWLSDVFPDIIEKHFGG